MSDDPSKHRGPDRTSPYAVSRLSAPVSLVDAAREIERADQWIASTSGAKLEQIAEQMRALRNQAEAVLREARENAALHRAEARFGRQPGKTYHLYEREGGQRYWSMLSPGDWRGAPPHPFVGSYRLEPDQSWTPVAATSARDRARQPVELWLERGLIAGPPSSETNVEARAPARTPREEDTPCESSSSPPSDPTGPD